MMGSRKLRVRFTDTHIEQGAVTGASRENLAKIMTRALGLNAGGKPGIARYTDQCGGGLVFRHRTFAS